MEINWNFPSSDYGQRHGISDSGVETFKGRPIKSLAREICQNSLDAGLPGETVKIVFEDFYFESDFPSRGVLEDALIRSKESWKNQKSSNTREFLNNALTTLRKEKIRFLRVSDYNTKGLLGSNEFGNSDWNNLVKASGSSDKGAVAGGSFGIGKFAPFVCSDFRTVFYSTLDLNGIRATQGVTRLVSFKKYDDSDEETQGIGYYGNVEKNQSIPDLIKFQEGYERTESGTDIYVAGFKKFENWEEDIIKEILDGFLYAIFMENLNIEVNGVQLSKDNLDYILEKYSNVITSNTKKYYETLISPKTKWIYTDFEGMGKVRIGLLILEDDAPRKVAMIRKPWMKIKDQASLNGSIPFVGVFIIEGEDLNIYLRKIENPQHTAWEPNRYEENTKINSARRIIKKMKELIISELNKMIIHDGIDELDLPGASDILPMESDENIDKAKEKDLLSPKITFIKTKVSTKVRTKIKNTESISKTEYDEMVEGGIINEGDDITVRGTGKGGNGENEGEGIPKGIDDGKDSKVKKRVTITPLNLRLISINKAECEYDIVFSSTKKALDSTLSLFELDEQGGKAPVGIIQAVTNDSVLKIENNKILGINISNEHINKIRIKVTKREYFSGEVNIDGIAR